MSLSVFRCKGSENALAQCCLKCCICCLWCLEQCLKFLNQNAYTIVGRYNISLSLLLYGKVCPYVCLSVRPSIRLSKMLYMLSMVPGAVPEIP